MDKTYQIFISGTGTREDQRRAVMARLIDLRQIPVSIDGFDPAEEAQWRAIEKRIAACDYFLRFAGAAEEADRSGALCALPRDYDVALLSGIPVGTLPLIPAGSDAAPLAAEAAEAAMTQLIVNHPRPGWLRGETVRPASAAEPEEPEVEPTLPPAPSAAPAPGLDVAALQAALAATGVEIGAFEHNLYVQKSLTLLDLFVQTHYSFQRGLSATDFLSLVLELTSGRVMQPDEAKLLNDLMGLGLVETRLALKPTSGRTSSATLYVLSAAGQDFAAELRGRGANPILDRFQTPESD